MASNDSVEFSDDFDDFVPVVIEEPSSRRKRGFTTSAGRGGFIDTSNLIPTLQNVHVSQPVVSRDSVLTLPVDQPRLRPTEDLPGPITGLGRASMLKTIQKNRTLKQGQTVLRENEYDVKSEIYTQLRQATGLGYSNQLIENAFPPTTVVLETDKPVPIPTPEKKADGQFDNADPISVPEEDHQFEGNLEDSPNLDWIDEQCADLKAHSLPIVHAGGQSKKKGKKGRNFRRVLIPSTDEVSTLDASGSSLVDGPKTKTITHIFEEKPDYRRSYLARKKDPFLLHSRDDFPAL